VSGTIQTDEVDSQMIGAAPILIVLLGLFMFSGSFGRLAIVGFLLLGLLFAQTRAMPAIGPVQNAPMAVPVEPVIDE
jgi:hypothetical protein